MFFIERLDLESVWGSGEGDLRSSSSPILLHRQFHDAPGVSNSFVGSLVDEELDEIHHLIELVLLGLDP